MASIFSLDDRDLRRLAKLYARAPKLMRGATATVLNNFAFGTRTEAIATITRQTTTRSKGLPRRAMRFEGARFIDPVERQESRAGAMEFDRFTGWVEQESGKQVSKRKRVPTIAARASASARRAVTQRNRLSVSNAVTVPQGYEGNSIHDKEVSMLRQESRKGHGGLMLITGKGVKSKRGIYRFHGSKKISPKAKGRTFSKYKTNRRKVKTGFKAGNKSFRRLLMVQDLSPPKPTKRNPWLLPSAKAYTKRVNKKRLWTLAIEKQILRKMGKR